MPCTSEQPAKLSAIAALVAEYYALVHPESPARSKAMQWLNRARKAIDGDHGINSSVFTEAVE